MSEQTYRLLNVGEVTQKGDEYWHKCWFIVGNTGNEVIEHSSPIRRPLWIPIAERKPEYPCIVLWRDGSVLYSPRAPTYPVAPTHWQPFIAPEPVKSEDEKGVEAWLDANPHAVPSAFTKLVWQAALAWERSRAK